jgi:hypothetical protein
MSITSFHAAAARSRGLAALAGMRGSTAQETNILNETAV